MKFGSKIYYCKKLEGVEKYAEPEEIILRPKYFSLQQTKGYSDVVTFGKEITKLYTAYAPISIWGKDKFKEKDKFYVDYAAPSQDEESYGDNANAYISLVQYDNLFIKLIIKKFGEIDDDR